MSLLEDVFLQDEAGEAQELERIIEGDEYDERPRDDANSDENSEKEDEAEEDKRRVDPSSSKTKRVVKNPRFVLNPARLTGPRGISVIPDHFKDFKFKGKGHEKEDLDLVLKKLEHWAYRLYPKFKFEDCLKKIETLGKKRPVTVHLTKIRSDQLVNDDTVVQKDSSDEELAAPLPPEEDEFDQLLQQQIDLARATPGPGDRSAFSTPHGDKRSPFMVPKATSSPSISDEQRERMIINRKLAEERRLARLKAAGNGNTKTVDLTNGNIDKNDSATNERSVNRHDENRAKKNRSNVIDSSDEEGELTINETVSVDIHNANKDIETYTNKNNVDLTKIQKPRSINNDVELVITGEPNKKKNVIHSDDDDEGMNEAITLDAPNSDPKVIDLTEVQIPKNTSNYVDLEITGVSTKKKNVINSDDDDEGMNESVNLEAPNSNPKLIDLTEVQIPKDTSNDGGLEITGVPSKKKNVMVNDDEDEEMNPDSCDQKVVDLTEGYPAQTRDNANGRIIEITETESHKDVLDSSDEDDGLVVSEAFVVDIHQTKTKNDEQINNKHVEDCVKDKQNKSIEENQNSIDNIDHIISNDDDITGKDTESKETNHSENNKNVQNNEEFENVKATENSDAVNMADDANTDADKVDIDKNISKEDDALDDLMEVDFSDDL